MVIITMNSSDNNTKSFNLPTYIQNPFFLYQDNRLDRPALLIASFLYSLHTAGKSFETTNDYLCQLALIKKRQLYVILNQLEDYKYISRSGFTNKNKIQWIYDPKAIITIVDTDTSAPECTNVQELNTSALQRTKLVHSNALNWCTPVHTYNKDNNKYNNTTTSSSINFEHYKKQEIEKLNQANESFTQEQKIERFKQESLADVKCNQVYEERFVGLDITLEELYQECVDYWSQTNQLVYQARFLMHLRKTRVDKYNKQSTNNVVNIDPNKPTQLDFQEFNAGVKGYDWVGEWIAKQKQG
jgi:hypothetical protein